jgi:hypothetical protein
MNLEGNEMITIQLIHLFIVILGTLIIGIAIGSRNQTSA